MLSKKDFVTLPKWPWPLWHFIVFWGPVMGDQKNWMKWYGTMNSYHYNNNTPQEKWGSCVLSPRHFLLLCFLYLLNAIIVNKDNGHHHLTHHQEKGIEMTMMIMVPQWCIVSYHLRPRWVFFSNFRNLVLICLFKFEFINALVVPSSSDWKLLILNQALSIGLSCRWLVISFIYL